MFASIEEKEEEPVRKCAQTKWRHTEQKRRRERFDKLSRSSGEKQSSGSAGGLEDDEACEILSRQKSRSPAKEAK